MYTETTEYGWKSGIKNRFEETERLILNFIGKCKGHNVKTI